MNEKNPNLLLVEDDGDDVFFMRRAMKHAGVACPLQVVSDGQQAKDYLAGAGKYADRESFPVPAMIVLDLKLPLVSGFEVLEWMRGQPGIGDLPVVILTGSSEERDKRRARELGVRGYYVKPPDEHMLREMLEGVALGTSQGVRIEP